MDQNKENVRELDIAELEQVNGGISQAEKKRRQKKKKKHRETVIWRPFPGNEQPAAESSMSATEYIDAHKEEFIIQFPDMKDILD